MRRFPGFIRAIFSDENEERHGMNRHRNGPNASFWARPTTKMDGRSWTMAWRNMKIKF